MTVEAGGAAAPADTPSSSAPIEHVDAPPNPLSEAPPAGEVKAEIAKPVPSTRDALRAAAARVEADEAAKAAVAAKDAKPSGDQPRDNGKFAAKAAEGKPGAEPAKPADAAAAKAAADATAAKPGEQPAPAKPAAVDPTAPRHAAPERFSPDAKAVWDTAPEPVKAEVARMHKEMTAGIEKHRAGAEAFEKVRQFHDMARQSGKELHDVVGAYVGMEQLLRTNPLKGLEAVCDNIGVSLKDVARIVLEQPPEAQQSQSDATIRELKQTVARLEQQVGGVTQTFQQQREQGLHQHISDWAASRPHFEVYAPHIAAEMRDGATDLDDAEARVFQKYPALATLAKANPSPQAEPKPAASSAAAPDLEAQTLKGQKSIAGAPSSGSEPAARPRSSSIKDALKRAASRAGV